jgi:hypothetical protein
MIPAENWQIYVATLPTQHITHSSAATLIPSIVGATSLLDDQRQAFRAQGCVFDDEGDNISPLNPFFCELTSVYWLLRNTQQEYVGNAHYRRKWNDEDLRHSEEGVLYVAHGQDFRGGLASQFYTGTSGFDAPAVTIGLAERGLLPFTVSQMKEVWEQPIFYGYNMVRGPRKYYEAFMKVAFECLWPIWEEHQEEIKLLDSYNRRMIGFISERMMTGLVLCRDSFFDFPVANSRVEFIQ